MREDHHKISSWEILSIIIIKDLLVKYFELLRYGSYKSFMSQSIQIDK